MDEGIAGAVADWEQRPFSGGYRGLHELVDRKFSGAVKAAGCWLLLINGRVVGLYEEYEGADGPEQEPVEIERFEGASGTVHEAPHAALPLLLTMQVRGGEVIARSPTKDRPLEEIQRELESEGFTGYLVLSEHVLSGEYYVVYQSGRSMSVAFIGGARRLKTDDEAFERAKKEVGIYEARAVRLTVFDVPEPADDAGGAGGTAVDDSEHPDETEPVAGGPAAESASSSSEPMEPRADAANSVAERRVDERSESTDEASGDDGAASRADEQDETETEQAPAVTDLDREPRPPERETADGDGPTVGDGTAEATAVEPAESREAEAEEAVTTAAPPEPDAVPRLEDRLDRLAERQAELAATVERLTARLDDIVGSGDDAFEPAEHLSPDEALAETTLLVRYRSEGDVTLAAVQEGGGDRDALARNLQLEPRTPFDAAKTAVDGRRYEEFLRSTVEYRFVEWLVEEFPFEVQATGATGSLAAIYGALPEIDRAEFGQPATEGGSQFDVVLRDRDGEPRVVAEVDEGTEPPSQATAEGLVRRTRDTEEETATLAAAFLVTTSFVDGAALEPVRDATRSRVLSRDRRKSYVNLSSGGFHLCLVEAGNESFHLAVPDL